MKDDRGSSPYFANKAAASAKAKHNFSFNVLGTAISVISLVISLAAFYVGVLSQTDDLRVSVDETGGAMFMQKSTLDTKFYSITEMTFINSGNRPAVVMQAATVFDVKNESKDLVPCEHPMGIELDLGLKPFVLKAGEVAYKKFNSVESIVIGQRLDKSRSSYVATACLMFSIITPSEYVQQIGRRLFAQKLEPTERGTSMIQSEKFSQKVIVIHRGSGTILSEPNFR